MSGVKQSPFCLMGFGQTTYSFPKLVLKVIFGVSNATLRVGVDGVLTDLLFSLLHVRPRLFL